MQSENCEKLTEKIFYKCRVKTVKILTEKNFNNRLRTVCAVQLRSAQLKRPLCGRVAAQRAATSLPAPSVLVDGRWNTI